MSYNAESLIEVFLDALWLKDGLSGNTQLSYGYDLLALDRWLKVRGTALAGVSRDDLLGFMADRKQFQSI